MSENMADQARKGLIDSVKGKAKEIAGAVTGNDSLTAEGQLEQTQAQERKEANSVAAVADAEAAQALADAKEAKLEGAQERSAVSAEAVDAKNAVRNENLADKQAAEQAGREEAAREKAKADAEAKRDVAAAQAEERVNVEAATDDAVNAVAEHQTVERVVGNAQEEADRLRQHADTLADDADLPK